MIFSLKKVLIFDGNWTPKVSLKNGTQGRPTMVKKGYQKRDPQKDPKKDVKWSQRGAQMDRILSQIGANWT